VLIYGMTMKNFQNKLLARTLWPRTKGFGILIVSHSEFERARKLVLEVNKFV